MHLFDTSDDLVISSRHKFWITLIILSVATWAAAALGFWSVRTGNWKRLIDWLGGLKWAKKDKTRTEKERASNLDV